MTLSLGLPNFFSPFSKRFSKYEWNIPIGTAPFANERFSPACGEMSEEWLGLFLFSCPELKKRLTNYRILFEILKINHLSVKTKK